MKFLLSYFKKTYWFNFFIFFSSILFVFFVEFYEYYSYKTIQKKIDEYSNTLSFLLWNLDKTTSKDYLNIILQNNDYNSIVVLLEDNSIFLRLNGDKISKLENFLTKINFVKIYKLSSDITYNNKTIGSIQVEWINKNGYIYNYVLIVIILLCVIFYFYIRLTINKKHLEKMNEQLEIEIKSKNEALFEVQKLKQQQDGDYFVTSLLLIPLSSNQGKSQQIDVEFFVKQKKSFSFKNKFREIGGDICISHILELRNRKYTVCLNADAMGKSILGAGGCLVLGSVFEALIERTKLSRSISQQLPERWLKNSFLELHKVFESFDGSMMASIFLCLIDNLTGFMYYIFAEHPYPIIYRNKEAVFLDTNFMFYKLGISLSSKSFLYVKTYQLLLDDIIFVGSDGKDDILLSKSENEGSIINTDENLFLRIIEDSEGDLNLIYNNVLKRGKLIDDFSVLKIHYKHNNLEYKINYIKDSLNLNFKEIENLKENINLLINEEMPLKKKLESIYHSIKRRILYLFKEKKYKEIIYIMEMFFPIFPEKEIFMFYLAYCYYKEGELVKALDYAEGLRLRNIKDKKVLILLARIYHKMQDKKRLDEIIDIINDLYPNETIKITYK